MKSRSFHRIMQICLVILLSLSTTAFAAEIRASEYISAYSADATKTRDGNFAVSYRVNGTKKMDAIGVSRLEVQWYNGSRWITEAVYTSADVPEFQATNKSYLSGKFTHTPENSGSYRAVVTVFAKDGNGSDTRVITTDHITKCTIVSPNGVAFNAKYGTYSHSTNPDVVNYLDNPNNIPINGKWTVTVKTTETASDYRLRINTSVCQICGNDGN